MGIVSKSATTGVNLMMGLFVSWYDRFDPVVQFIGNNGHDHYDQFDITRVIRAITSWPPHKPA